MKIFILFPIFLISCNQSDVLDFFYDRTEPLYQRSTNDESENNACDANCEKICAKVFIDSSAENKCESYSNRDVREIDDTYEKMRSGKWDSIDSNYLELMVSISYEPWERRAGSSFKNSKRMLVWVAEISEQSTVDVIQLVTTDVLKEALYSLGDSRRNINGIREGLKEDLKTSDNEVRSFLEMLAWENNDEIFEKVYAIIKEECSSRDLCIKDVYCDHSEDIIFETVTELGLHESFITSSRFHKGLCS